MNGVFSDCTNRAIPFGVFGVISCTCTMYGAGLALTSPEKLKLMHTRSGRGGVPPRPRHTQNEEKAPRDGRVGHGGTVPEHAHAKATTCSRYRYWACAGGDASGAAYLSTRTRKRPHSWRSALKGSRRAESIPGLIFNSTNFPNPIEFGMHASCGRQDKTEEATARLGGSDERALSPPGGRAPRRSP